MSVIVPPAPDVTFHPRAGAAPPYRPAGPNGERYCRWCAQQITAKRRTLWCSEACVQSYAAHTPNGVRAAVFRRDGGVCCWCGLDTVAARQMLPLREEHAERPLWYSLRRVACRRYLAVIGIPVSRIDADWWDADHIVPARLGGLLVLENLRTLCVRCHARRSAADRRRPVVETQPCVFGTTYA